MEAVNKASLSSHCFWPAHLSICNVQGYHQKMLSFSTRKIGSDLVCARSVFDKMVVKDVLSWKILIGGYSERNRLKEVRALSKLMQDEVQADKVSMVKVI
ncbi:unnamed protein product [Urochloa humidicola]